jgi:hypothetical protein
MDFADDNGTVRCAGAYRMTTFPQMKTTLNLDDALMQAARERARRMGVTLTALISDALRRALAEPAPAEFRLDLPVTQGRRMPIIDVDSNAALEEYLDRMEQRRAMS